MNEMVLINAKYGPNVMEYGVSKAYLRNRSNGRCVFQRPLMDKWICTLQVTKPTACRLFPFRIHKKPVYKEGDTAGYVFNNQKYYLYLDPSCEGVILGKPSERFRTQIIPEIMSIGIGLAVKQRYTTSSNIHWKPT